MRLIDADDFRHQMYTEVFIKDNAYQKYGDSRIWIRYKLFEKVLQEQPTLDQMLYGYNIEHLAFIAALLQKENISPEELKSMLEDIGRMTRFVVDDIMETIQRNWKVTVNDKLMEVGI